MKMFKQGKGHGIGCGGVLLQLFLMLVLASVSFQSTFAGETVTYYHNDALGSPVAATDKNGAVVWREEYKPFGERIVKEDGGTNTRWYTGKHQEEETGLSYFGARWYDPNIGRFMAMDPADVDPGNHHSFNRYAYANNNPYVYVDPNGQSPLDIGFLLYDIGKLGVALYTGVGVGAAVADVGMSILGVASPIPGTGQALKGLRLAKTLDKVKDTSDTLKGLDNARGFVPKSVPNPGGRLGKQSTRDHIDSVATEMENRGWTITGGGNRLPEEYLPGPGGGRKGSSFPDITATKDGRTLRVNTVDTRADGITPSTREATNAARIRAQTPGDHLLLIPKP